MRALRDPNEPSIHDHDAPYNEEEYLDENGEVQVRCGCSSCKEEQRRLGREDYDYLIDKQIEKADALRDAEKDFIPFTERK